MIGAKAAADSAFYWQCVALCLQARERGLKVIERHRLNQFIALHRAGSRVPKPVAYAAMRIVAACQARQRSAHVAGTALPTRAARCSKGF